MNESKIEKVALTVAAICSLILSGAVAASILYLLMLLSSLAVLRPAFAQSTTAGVRLEAGIEKEDVDGDLKSAIEIYQKIANDSSAPRDVRSKALLRLAGCYEKLGRQAREVYQQIVRDFADQPAATQARARLAALKQDDHPAAPATLTQRKIEMLGRRMGPGDTDGHRAVYLNDATGELIYGDLAGHSKRVIFKAEPYERLGWFPSRDFSIVGLHLYLKPNSDQETLAVVNTDGTGYREIARRDGRGWEIARWSWDSRYILLRNQSQDGTSRLLRISVADGRIHELLSLKTGVVRAATFSPDGRFVAYQLLPPSGGDPNSRIFVLPAEGGAPQLVYEERLATGVAQYFQALKLLDWTPDGRYLATASERTGKAALHLLPIRDGKSAGAPVFLRYGDFEEGVTTADGRLVYSSVKPGGAWVVHFASLDPNSRLGDWKRLDLNLGNATNPGPEWSDDSNQIVSSAHSEDVGQSGEVVRLHNLSTGEDREIYHSPGITHCAWAVQQPKLFCSECRAENTAVFSIAVDSGEIARFQTFPASWLMIGYPSRDDRALYLYEMLAGGEEGGKLLRWEIATERETILEKFPSGYLGGVSPDGRCLIRLGKQNLEIRPTSGGDWKPLVSLGKIFSTGHFNVTPDGNWLLYHDVDSAGKHSLFRVSTAGGQPECLGDFPTKSPSGTLEISPDGRKIIVASGEFATGHELWSLENFVPPAKQ